jgi:hypothetical protein
MRPRRLPREAILDRTESQRRGLGLGLTGSH